MQINDFQLLLKLSGYHAGVITEKVKQLLLELRDKELLTSGNDSGLKNVWEEVCVQVQGEQSYYWDAYLVTINNFILDELSKQPAPVIDLLNYVGSFDLYDGKDEDFELLNEYGVQEISKKLLLEAEFYTNDYISAFLENDIVDEKDNADDDT